MHFDISNATEILTWFPSIFVTSIYQFELTIDRRVTRPNNHPADDFIIVFLPFIIIIIIMIRQPTYHATSPSKARVVMQMYFLLLVGAYGTVYRAEDLKRNEIVAMKKVTNCLRCDLF